MFQNCIGTSPITIEGVAAYQTVLARTRVRPFSRSLNRLFKMVEICRSARMQLYTLVAESLLAVPFNKHIRIEFFLEKYTLDEVGINFW